MDSTPALPANLSSAWLELGDAQRLLLKGYPGIVLLLAPGGRLLGTNAAGAERLGRDRDAPGGDDAALVAPLAAADGTPAVSREAALEPGAEHDWTLLHRDGSPQPARLAIGALRDREGRPVGLIAVEPWPRAGEDAEPLFHHHDTLTGLPTGAVLTDRAEMALQRAARQKTVVALLLVEIAGFEALCREHGRSVGDDLLRATASRLHFELRKTDTAVRLEGGRFAVMLVDLHGPEEAAQVAGKIRPALSAPINVGVARLAPDVRIGVAWSPVHGDQLLPLLRAAESALGEVDATQGGIASATAPAAA